MLMFQGSSMVRSKYDAIFELGYYEQELKLLQNNEYLKLIKVL
jgi:hypothetical protein